MSFAQKVLCSVRTPQIGNKVNQHQDFGLDDEMKAGACRRPANYGLPYYRSIV